MKSLKPCHIVAALVVAFSSLMPLPLGAQPAGAAPCPPKWSWESTYDDMRYVIHTEHWDLPDCSRTIFPGCRDLWLYLRALDTQGADMNEAMDYALCALNNDKEFWFNKFMDLADDAREAGNGTLREAMGRFLYEQHPMFPTRSALSDWCFRSEIYGIPLYKKAGELGFDKKIVKDDVQNLMDLSIQNLQAGKVDCLWTLEGNIDPCPEDGLQAAERVRRICRYFSLPSELNRCTELMNKYLIEVLCLKWSDAYEPWVAAACCDQGHHYYLNLANQHNLQRAKSHIEGFYATLYGKVEKQTDEGLEPVPGAQVTVVDPHGGPPWPPATADQDGNYEIKGALLHKQCSPFNISAEDPEGTCSVTSTYEGPLEAPDSGHRHEKNLVLECELKGVIELVMGPTWPNEEGWVEWSGNVLRIPFSIQDDTVVFEESGPWVMQITGVWVWYVGGNLVQTIPDWVENWQISNLQAEVLDDTYYCDGQGLGCLSYTRIEQRSEYGNLYDHEGRIIWVVDSTYGPRSTFGYIPMCDGCSTGPHFKHTVLHLEEDD